MLGIVDGGNKPLGFGQWKTNSLDFWHVNKKFIMCCQILHMYKYIL